MTFLPIYRKSHHLNLHLTTNDKKIHALIDDILDEICFIKDVANKPKTRETLKKIVLNLIHTDGMGGSIRIPRDKNRYCHHRLYKTLWFKYDYVILAVDGLIDLGYVEHQKGFWDTEKKRGYQTKIWASDKFRGRLTVDLLARSKKCIDREEPEQVIHLKDDKKKLVKYVGVKPVIKMRERLTQYNNFIREQYVTVKLPEQILTDNEFWINNLLTGLLNGNYGLDSLALNQDMDLSSTGKEHKSYAEFITNTSRICSTSPYTFTSVTRSLYRRSTSTCTLISHILNLIHLCSTQEKPSNRLVDNAFMISEEHLCEYFLSWLLFLGKDLRIGKEDDEVKQAFRARNTLGQLGMAELVFRLKYKSLHRVFNMSSFKKGGRFYGSSHIGIPSHMRGFININGEPCVELDYDALHVVMLYHLQGIDFDLAQDPYEMIVGPEDRTIKKIALLTAINAPNDEKAVGGIRKKLVKLWYKGDILLDKSLKSLLERAKLAHPDIAADIASGKGRMLQNLDSKIADAILTNLMAEKIPTLPVHDSFLVPQQYEDLLRQQMKDEYEKVMKFRPGVSKKKKRFIPKKWEK